MSIVLLKTFIKNKEKTQKQIVKGILNLKTNILIYNDTTSINKIDLSNNILDRENDEIKIILPFKLNEEVNALFYEKRKNIQLNMKIYTKSLTKTHDIFRVKYSIENNDEFEYYIEVIKIIKK